MVHPRNVHVPALAAALLTVAVTVPGAQVTTTVTSPREHFGFTIGDDYQLASYSQFAAYWQTLDRQSDRLRVVDIGRTAEGRPQLMAIVTSPENHRQLDTYRESARRLALAEGLSETDARALARAGKAVVWIDGGLHATEVLGAHQLIETVYRLVSRTDPETLRILDDVVVLAVHANPDGMELVSSWYMRHEDPLRRGTGPGIPRLYQKYVGHDNNRDFYLSSQPETTNMNRVLYREWFPQIVYNHHQSGPAGTVMFAPPFRDPFNYRFDPLIPAQLDLIGAAMHSRFAAEGKPGVVSRRAASYSTWWNGGLRTTAYFHNMIGLLTETIGSPTPIRIPFVPRRQLPDSSGYFPIEPQEWRFSDSIEYSVTANYAVLDIASRNREHFLYNIYRMGRNSIERGSRDSWTPRPGVIDAAQRTVKSPGSEDEFARLLRDPALRDPRGFIMPSDSPEFPTAVRFVNALFKTGVAVHRATAPFTLGGRAYPAGSYVVKTAQAFRPHVLDMFEPQDHPHDVPYQGGPPERPYDSAGWTLALLMGVAFDRVLEAFDGPFEPVSGPQAPPPGRVTRPSATGFLLRRTNDAFIAVNRLLAAGEEVAWVQAGPEAGAFYVGAGPSSRRLVQQLARELGVSFEGVSARPAGEGLRLRPVRLALADVYGGSMPSGWTRWILEQYEFPFEVVFPQAVEAGDLATRYDAIVLPSGVWPAAEADRSSRPVDPSDVPAEYRERLGAYDFRSTGPHLRAFVEEGGIVLGVGRSSSGLAALFELPLTSHVTERTPEGESRPLPPEKYFVPGSVLRMHVDTDAPVAHGVTNPVDVFFDNNPVLRPGPDASLRGVRPVAWFGDAAPLRSGWGLGQGYLRGGLQVVEARVGRGAVYLFAPEITFRGQPHGTFKFLFNGIQLAAARGAGASRATGRPARSAPLAGPRGPLAAAARGR